MRPLTKTEKKLAVVLFGVLFLMTNFLLLPSLSKMQTRYKAAIDNARIEQTSENQWLKNKARWQGREAWINAHQPQLAHDGNDESTFLESLQKSAREHKITIIEQSLLEPKSEPSYQEIGAKLNVTASLENLTRWVATLQNPELFQAITSFSLKSDAEPPNVKCGLQVTRWYAPKNP